MNTPQTEQKKFETRELAYDTLASGDVNAYIKENGTKADNPVAIIKKIDTTYSVLSRVTDEEYTLISGATLENSKTALSKYLISEKLLPN